MSSDPLVMKLIEENKALTLRLSRGKNRLLNLVAEIELRERGTTHWEGCAERHWPCRVIESALAAVNELEGVVERRTPESPGINDDPMAFERRLRLGELRSPKQWWCPVHGGLIDHGKQCLYGCPEPGPFDSSPE